MFGSSEISGVPSQASNHRVEMNRHQLSCLPGRLGYLMILMHTKVLGQVAVTHSGRWTHVHKSSGPFSMTASLKSDASRNLVALGIAARFGCRSIRARAIAKSHGWRRLVTGRSVDRGTTRLVDEFATGGVTLESLHVGRHESSNHRVERTAASYGASDHVGFRFGSVADRHLWSAAVSHSGRSTHPI